MVTDDPFNSHPRVLISLRSRCVIAGILFKTLDISDFRDIAFIYIPNPSFLGIVSDIVSNHVHGNSLQIYGTEI